MNMRIPWHNFALPHSTLCQADTDPAASGVGGGTAPPQGDGTPPKPAGHGAPQSPAAQDPLPYWVIEKEKRAEASGKKTARSEIYRELGIDASDPDAAKAAFGEHVKNVRASETEFQRVKRESETMQLSVTTLKEQLATSQQQITDLTGKIQGRDKFDAIDSAIAALAKGSDETTGLIPHEPARQNLREAIGKSIGIKADGTPAVLNEKGKPASGQTVEEFVQAFATDNLYFFQARQTADGGGSVGGTGEGAAPKAFDPLKATAAEKQAELVRRTTSA